MWKGCNSSLHFVDKYWDNESRFLFWGSFVYELLARSNAIVTCRAHMITQRSSEIRLVNPGGFVGRPLSTAKGHHFTSQDFHADAKFFISVVHIWDTVTWTWGTHPSLGVPLFVSTERLGTDTAGYYSRSMWPRSACCSTVPVPTKHKLVLVLGYSGIFYYNWFLSRIVSRGSLKKASGSQGQHIMVFWSIQTWSLWSWVSRVGMGTNYSHCTLLCFFPFLLLGIILWAPDITGKTPSLKCISSLEMYAWIFLKPCITRVARILGGDTTP